MKRLLRVSVFAGCLFYAGQASAGAIDTVLADEKSHGELCAETIGSTSFVKPDALARQILIRLGFSKADLASIVPGSKPYSAATLSILLNATEENDQDPLGLNQRPTLKTAVAALRNERASLQFFVTNAELEDRHEATTDYVVRVPYPHLLNDPVGGPTYLDLFGPRRPIMIECPKTLKKRKSSLLIDLAGRLKKATKNRLRLRGKVKDLKKPASKGNLQSLSTADVSFTENNASGADIFAVSGVFGFDLTTDSGPLLIPFAEYRRSETRKSGGNKEVEVLALGLLYNELFISPEFALDLDVTPRFTLDLEQSSEELSLEISAEPAFDLAGIPVGIYSYHGPLRIRPELIFTAQGDFVLDAGTNPALQEKDDFYRIGGTAGIQAQFVDIPLLSNFVFEASYAWFHVASSPLDEIERLELGASYYLGGIPSHYVLSFSYVDGRNLLSLQQEEFWKLSFGARF